MKKWYLPAAFAIALAACDGDSGTSTGGIDRGDFDADISGEYDVRVRGEAYSTNTPGFSQDEILLYGTGSNDDVIIDILHLDDSFDEGTSPIIDGTSGSDLEGIGALVYFGDEDRYFISVDGSLDLDEINNAGIEGRARFTAVETDEDGFPLDNGNEVDVDVTFITDYQSSLTSRRPLVTSVRPAKRAPALR